MARHFVEARLRGTASPRLVDDAALLTTELAANAVRHATSGCFGLSLSRHGDRVRVEVADASLDPPIVLRPDPMATSGRGLMLVDALADRWGFERRPDGKIVWFELAS